MVTHTELIKERKQLLSVVLGNNTTLHMIHKARDDLNYNAVLLKASLQHLHGLSEREAAQYINKKDLSTMFHEEGCGWE